MTTLITPQTWDATKLKVAPFSVTEQKDKNGKLYPPAAWLNYGSGKNTPVVIKTGWMKNTSAVCVPKVGSNKYTMIEHHRKSLNWALPDDQATCTEFKTMLMDIDAYVTESTAMEVGGIYPRSMTEIKTKIKNAKTSKTTSYIPLVRPGNPKKDNEAEFWPDSVNLYFMTAKTIYEEDQPILPNINNYFKSNFGLARKESPTSKRLIVEPLQIGNMIDLEQHLKKDTYARFIIKVEKITNKSDANSATCRTRLEIQTMEIMAGTGNNAPSKVYAYADEDNDVPDEIDQAISQGATTATGTGDEDEDADVENDGTGENTDEGGNTPTDDNDPEGDGEGDENNNDEDDPDD